jgi:hypothetical protein
MGIKKFNNFKESKSPKYLTIQDLDKLDYKGIMDHRYDFLEKLPSKLDFHKSEEKRYLDEVELYTHLRFVEERKAQYNKWRNDEDEDLADFFKGMSDEKLDWIEISSFKEKYGSPKYILFELPNIKD